MLAKVKKDQYKRSFVYLEKRLLVNKLFLFDVMRGVDRCFFKKTAYLTNIRNHCVYSHKSRSVFKRFKCSRIFFRSAVLNSSIGSCRKQSFLFSSFGCS